MASKQGAEFEESLGRGLIGMFRKPLRLIPFGIACLICYEVTKNLDSAANSLGLTGVNRFFLLFVFLIPAGMLILWSNDAPAGGMKDDPFEEINFKNKNGQTPKRIAKYRDPKDKRVIVYEYRLSGKPFLEWMTCQRDIESAMNVTIRNIRQSPDDNQTVIMETVSPKYRLPVSTRENPFMWDEKLGVKDEGKVVVGQELLDPIVVDLNKLPHLLFAGTTGSGKSVIVQCVLWQLVKKGALPIVIDFKGGIEFGGDWENYGKVVTELDDALEIVNLLTAEQEARFRFLRDDGAKYHYECKNIKQYNAKHPDSPLTRIIFVVDEAGDLLSQEGRDKEDKQKVSQLTGGVMYLAMKARAVGINIILGIQRPDAKVLNGQIRNNIPVKVCGRCMGGDGRYLSEMVLGDQIATTLDATIEGRFYGNFGSGIEQFQSYFFEPTKFLTPNPDREDGLWRKGKTLILEKPRKPVDDEEHHTPIAPKIKVETGINPLI